MLRAKPVPRMPTPIVRSLMAGTLGAEGAGVKRARQCGVGFFARGTTRLFGGPSAVNSSFELVRRAERVHGGITGSPATLSA